MKRVILFTVFIFAVLLVSSYSFANEEDLDPSISPSPTPTLTPKPVDYQLPYSGLLPDSPLYFLKVARDRISDFLISDPLKQAEFDLLQADKRLNAGVSLFDKGKQDLAEVTISKGENYFEKAIQNIETAKKQGQDTSSLLEKIQRSVKKHQEVLKSLEKTAPQNIRAGINSLLKRSRDFENKVINLREK